MFVFKKPIFAVMGKGKTNMLIANKIKKLRQQHNLTQKQLAKLIGTNQNIISYWELGKFEPNIFNCILLADAFNVSLDELCCRDFRKEN